MQISKILTNKKVLAMAVGLVCASAIGFSAPAQAHGYGCSTCKVVKYRSYNRCYKPCYNYSGCCYRNYSCNYCNSCNYGYRCSGCGYGYGYGDYGYSYGGYYY